MELTVSTEKHFDSAHYLKDYNGACGNLHGHRWYVRVWVTGEHTQLDNGLLWDFSNLKTLVKELDHKVINDVVEFNPTAEHLAIYFAERVAKDVKGKVKVRVYENPDSYAEAVNG